MAVTLLTEKDLLKLAQLSCIKLEPHELGPLCESLDAVLNYASRLKGIAAQYPEVVVHKTRSNVFRKDETHLCGTPIVTYAQAHENNYFVVPVIIKQA